MKKLLLAVTGLALLSGSAFAADMTPAPMYKAPPPPPPAASWTGCSINAGYGYGMWNQDQFVETVALVPVTSNITSGGRGWLARFGGGCDYQFAAGALGNWVIGAFGDYDVMDAHGDFEAGVSGLAGEEKQTGAWYAGGRIGYLVTPALLTYFDGGYTQTHFSQMNLINAITQAPAAVMPSQSYHGWFVGGGTEYALNFSWLPIRGLFWRNEYRFSTYDAANVSVLPPGGGAAFFVENIRPYTETITSSLVWRFNWLGQ
jgi:outer membrane immunogenic protein